MAAFVPRHVYTQIFNKYAFAACNTDFRQPQLESCKIYILVFLIFWCLFAYFSANTPILRYTFFLISYLLHSYMIFQICVLFVSAYTYVLVYIWVFCVCAYACTLSSGSNFSKRLYFVCRTFLLSTHGMSPHPLMLHLFHQVPDAHDSLLANLYFISNSYDAICRLLRAKSL